MNNIPIPPYFVKKLEESARAVGLAVFLYVVQVAATWDASTFNDPEPALRSLAAGLGVIIWATVRSALTPKAGQ